MNNFFAVFRTGTHTDSNGITRHFTEQDLDTLISNYDPKNDEAPIVIGHPKSNAPAYGWIGELKRIGQTLYAKASSIIPEFTTALKQGLFKKRSCSFNITPQGLTLRHIGFLGATPPAVKALDDLNLDLSQSTNSITIHLDNPISDHLSESINLMTEEINSPVTEAEPTPEVSIPEISPPQIPEPDIVQPTIQEVASQPVTSYSSSVKSDIQKQLEKLYLNQRKTEFEIFLNEKIAFGSITPAMKTTILKLLEPLSSISFSDEDNLTSQFNFSDNTTADPKELLVDFINSIPKLINFETIATKEENELINKLSFTDSFDGFTIDPQSLELHKKASLISHTQKIPYKEALFQVHN